MVENHCFNQFFSFLPPWILMELGHLYLFKTLYGYNLEWQLRITALDSIICLLYLIHSLVFIFNIQPWRTPFPIWNQSVVPCHHYPTETFILLHIHPFSKVISPLALYLLRDRTPKWHSTFHYISGLKIFWLFFFLLKILRKSTFSHLSSTTNALV